MHVYEVRPRKDKRGVDLISDMLPFGYERVEFLWIFMLDPSLALGLRNQLWAVSGGG
jgi:hypothetical protein